MRERILVACVAAAVWCGVGCANANTSTDWLAVDVSGADTAVLFADSSLTDNTAQTKSDTAKADAVVNATPVIAINEVACGENPDWIELYNPGSSTVDLAGWTFSDTLADETVRASFPADSIVPAKGFLVVEITDEANGFKLAKDEAVAIYRPDGSTMDSVDWDDGACVTDTSYARIPDGVGEFVTTSKPTADKPNQK